MLLAFLPTLRLEVDTFVEIGTSHDARVAKALRMLTERTAYLAG
jgi:hypothetical protein